MCETSVKRPRVMGRPGCSLRCAKNQKFALSQLAERVQGRVIRPTKALSDHSADSPCEGSCSRQLQAHKTSVWSLEFGLYRPQRERERTAVSSCVRAAHDQMDTHTQHILTPPTFGGRYARCIERGEAMTCYDAKPWWREITTFLLARVRDLSIR